MEQTHPITRPYGAAQWTLILLWTLALAACGDSDDAGQTQADTSPSGGQTSNSTSDSSNNTSPNNNSTSADNNGTSGGTGNGTSNSTSGADTSTGTGDGTSSNTTTGDLCDRITLGNNGDLQGLQLFPEDSYWNQPVTDAEVDPNSDAIIASIGANTGLHPDFGCCFPGPFGIPYVVVDGSTGSVPIAFLYADESEPGPYPIPPDAPIEGGPDATGDRHVLVLECTSGTLYEVFNAHPQDDGSWEGDSGAVWNLERDPIRAPYCTSADAAGLPILPGLVRYDEVERGDIPHALRFTVSQTRRAFVRPPASHWASSSDDPDLPPMGMRVRLVSDEVLAADGIDVDALHPQVQVLLRALQTYGMILADNGSDWYISGMPHPSWDDGALVSQLRQIQGRHFEVLRMDGLVDDYDDLEPNSCQLP